MQTIDLINDDPFVDEPAGKSSFSSAGFQVDWRTLVSGRSSGVQLLTVDTGRLKATVIPTRGMGLWKAWSDEFQIGWDSPVRGPVHPALVPLEDPSGVGWLEGFDELLVRCGLSSNGAPEFDSNGKLLWPLHGRIANQIATRLWLEIDEERGILDVVGIVPETRFLVNNLVLETRYRFRYGQSEIEIMDKVTNASSMPATMQLLYHINIGSPILEAGSEVFVASKKVIPRDQRAADGFDCWSKCGGPTVGYAEQVYFIEPVADRNGFAEAAIVNSLKDRGLSVTFEVSTLPFMTFWKNTAALQDGYVVGIEPATGYPNPRSTEAKHDRLIPLPANGSITFSMKLQPLNGSTAVEKSLARIKSVSCLPNI